MTPNRHTDLIKMIYFQCLLREGVAPMFFFSAHRRDVLENIVSCTFSKISLLFFSQVLSAHALEKYREGRGVIIYKTMIKHGHGHKSERSDVAVSLTKTTDRKDHETKQKKKSLECL